MKLQSFDNWPPSVPGYWELNAARDDASYAGIPQTVVLKEWRTQLLAALNKGNYKLQLDDDRLLLALGFAEYLRLQKLRMLPQVPPDLQALQATLKQYTKGTNAPYTIEEQLVLCALRVILGKGVPGLEEPACAHFRLISQRATGPLRAQLLRFFPL